MTTSITLKYHRFEQEFDRCYNDINTWMEDNSVYGWYSTAYGSQFVIINDDDAIMLKLKFGNYIV